MAVSPLHQELHQHNCPLGRPACNGGPWPCRPFRGRRAGAGLGLHALLPQPPRSLPTQLPQSARAQPREPRPERPTWGAHGCRAGITARQPRTSLRQHAPHQGCRPLSALSHAPGTTTHSNPRTAQQPRQPEGLPSGRSREWAERHMRIRTRTRQTLSAAQVTSLGETTFPTRL